MYPAMTKPLLIAYFDTEEYTRAILRAQYALKMDLPEGLVRFYRLSRCGVS